MFDKNAYVSYLKIQRTREKRERETLRETNRDARRVWVPFAEWLRFKHSVNDWRGLHKHDLWKKYNDYQIDCLQHKMYYETPENYGLKNTLF